MTIIKPVIRTYTIPHDVELVDFATGGDFGATKERLVMFGLEKDDNLYRIIRLHWSTADNVPLSQMIDAFHSEIRNLDSGKYSPPEKAGLGLAGPILEDGKKCDLTNSPKVVTIDELSGLGIDARLYNDFFVNGAAIPFLRADQRVKLEHTLAAKKEYHSDMVFAQGPGGGHGFGLGERLSDGRFKLSPSEGGHTLYGSTGLLEDAIVAYIRENVTNGSPVECEQIGSGIGVSYIFKFFAEGKIPKKDYRYAAVCELRDKKYFKKLMDSIKELPPALQGRRIIEAYRGDMKELRVGIEIAVGACAMAAINAIQLNNAWGGEVNIFGGNARRSADVFKGTYMSVFDNPYLFADGMRATDVFLVTARDIGSMGGAALRLKPQTYVTK